MFSFSEMLMSVNWLVVTFYFQSLLKEGLVGRGGGGVGSPKQTLYTYGYITGVHIIDGEVWMRSSVPIQSRTYP